LLAFARRQPLQPQRVEVNAIVSAITKLLGRTLGENIEITLGLAPDLWPATIDPVQLEAALTNLATNARDAMPKGGRLIFVTRNHQLDDDYAHQHPGLAPGDYAMIEVSDTGGGIPSDHLSRIFDPFFTTKEQGKGTGLGLSMVFGYMKQSGGHINVYSEIGVGTTFRLYLPRADAGLGTAERAPSRDVQGSHGETVLVVEDNASLRRVLVRQLDSLGYEVLEAENASAALMILDHTRVDLLLTDIVMPGKVNGLELARVGVERWPAMQVILTSGFPNLNVHDGLGAAAAAVRFLNKPYRKEDLARTLRDALDG
jgi:CheY-like chemotaxis protein